MNQQFLDYVIIIPAHNEEEFLPAALQSVLNQSLQPLQVIVVNDHSSDRTETIINEFAVNNTVIKKVNTTSSNLHLPGSKVINAFNAGLKKIDQPFDFIVQLDADVILPSNYFEVMSQIFSNHPRVGIAGGFFYELSATGEWLLNHPMDKDHIRGAFKAYTKSCFETIGGLRNAMGWDTLDELLARYHGYDLYTEDSLKVKNQRPIGNAYSREARLLQGRAMYQMGYGLRISGIASLKMAVMKRNPLVFIDNLRGFFQARKEKAPYLVSSEEMAFIRRLRWRNIRKKLF